MGTREKNVAQLTMNVCATGVSHHKWRIGQDLNKRQTLRLWDLIPNKCVCFFFFPLPYSFEEMGQKRVDFLVRKGGANPGAGSSVNTTPNGLCAIG